MEELHSMAVQLFQLVNRYEETVKEKQDNVEAQQLKAAIVDLELKLRAQRLLLKTS